MKREKQMVAVFRSANHDAEMEAINIRSLLAANGVDSILAGPGILPSLEFQVQVSEEKAAEAHDLIREARAAGPKAAREAEALTEK